MFMLPVSDTLALCVYVMPKVYLELILRQKTLRWFGYGAVTGLEATKSDSSTGPVQFFWSKSKTTSFPENVPLWPQKVQTMSWISVNELRWKDDTVEPLNSVPDKKSEAKACCWSSECGHTSPCGSGCDAAVCPPEVSLLPAAATQMTGC